MDSFHPISGLDVNTANASQPSDGSGFASFFQSIPPERVGLHGEYDHSGLAKRVTLAFRRSFNAHEVGSVKIAQRGGVVVLTGTFKSQHLLNQLIDTAMKVEGAVGVEVNGSIILRPLNGRSPGYLAKPAYAI